jgi:hypothetical protein
MALTAIRRWLVQLLSWEDPLALFYLSRSHLAWVFVVMASVAGPASAQGPDH